MGKTRDPRPAPPGNWLDDLAEARADYRAGRVQDVDLDALCGEIEAEAAEIEARQRRQGMTSRA